jgi:3-phenylpropionate/trans-cinnamate dioxygenase ferredoxin subunit
MIPVCRVEDLPPGGAVRLDGDVPIAVFNDGGELYALDDTCSHQDASLADGWLEDCAVECPLHASRFDLRTGRPTGGPARNPVRAHPVTVVDGVVYV